MSCSDIDSMNFTAQNGFDCVFLLFSLFNDSNQYMHTHALILNNPYLTNLFLFFFELTDSVINVKKNINTLKYMHSNDSRNLSQTFF